MKDFDLMAILLNPAFSKMIVHGVEMTLKIAVASWSLAMSLALVLLTVRLTRNRFADAFVAGYVSYHRNVPTLVQLMLWYFGISSLLPADLQGWLGEHGGEVVFAVIALGLCQAAYFCEDLRSGLRSLPPGQAEASRALGHSYIGSMRHVILPQAVTIATAPTVGFLVQVVKGTALASVIGFVELTKAGSMISNATFKPFVVFSCVALLYFALCFPISLFAKHLERKVNVNRR